MAEDEHVLIDDDIAVEFHCRTVPAGAVVPSVDT